jgi:DNA-binding response OmpR family regulator
LIQNYTEGVAPPILLVDDDLSLAQLMTMSISTMGVPVEHCATGEVAIELLQQKAYAVVVVDLILEGGKSGIYVVNAIRDLAKERRPAILMVTGGNLENLRGVDRALVTAVMLKPLDIELFTDYVLATYRRALNLQSEAGVIAAVIEKVRTYCGDCGAEIEPWVAERNANDGLSFETWLDTPCASCGTSPRLSCRGHSEWAKAS